MWKAAELSHREEKQKLPSAADPNSLHCAQVNPVGVFSLYRDLMNEFELHVDFFCHML